MGEAEFGEAVWWLDRWQVARRVREWVWADQEAYRRWRELFGYVLGNREGMDAYGQIAARWRRHSGRKGPVVRAGSEAAEKAVEVQISGRFKGQRRSWDVVGADRLMQLRWLRSDRHNWEHWWDRTCLSTTKVNPGWTATDN